MAHTILCAESKACLAYFKSMIVFVKHDTSVGWAKYVKTTDFKNTHIKLYRELRRQYMNGNRAGIQYLDYILVYFENNFVQDKDLIKVKCFERFKTSIKVINEDSNVIDLMANNYY